MAEIIFDKIKIPKENLARNKNNSKWQEIRRASNIFASLILNKKDFFDTKDVEFPNVKLADFYLYSDSIAYIVNMSFSIELALKTILEHQGNLKSVHKLDELFLRLDPPTRRLIIRYLNTTHCLLGNKYNSEQEFVEALKPINELFIKYRYFFDDKYDLKNFNEDLSLLLRLFYILVYYINYKLK